MAHNRDPLTRPETPGPLPVDPGAAIRRAIRRTLLGLWAERLAQAFWPFATVAGFVFAALWSGLAGTLDPVWLGWAAVVAVLALVFTVLRGLWRLQLPRRAEAVRRLDAAMPGRPLSALADTPAVGGLDPAGRRVWEAHQLRMARIAAMARGVPGNARLPDRDPFALRHVAILAVALALLFGGPDRVTGIGPVAAPFGPSGADAAPGPSWEGWIQPPAYTGEPSLYLNAVDSPTLRVPEGSRVTLRLYAGDGVLTVVETVSGRDGGAEAAASDGLPAGISAHGFEIARSGILSIRGPGGRDWEIAMRPDAPPVIRPEGGIQRERGGRLRQDFIARDDYGVTGGTVRIALDLDAVDRRFGLAAEPDPREELVLTLPLPIAGSRTSFSEAVVEDLSRHPWAHMPVRLVLEAEDARGQVATALPVTGILPARRFFDPLAAALVELRRDLLWAVANGPRSAALIRSLRHRPAGFLTEPVAEELTAILTALETGLDGRSLDPELRDELAEALWELAVAIEEGDAANAEERLRRAQERLAEAIRQGADPDEIDELMQELRQAMREAMRERMRNQPPDVGDSPDQGERQEITGDMIQQMLDRIRELMDQGRTDEALALLEQLQQLLDNLEVVQGEGGEGGDGDNPLSGLGETLRDQQGLADETFRDLQDQFGPRPGTGQGREGAQPRGEQGPGEQGQGEQGAGEEGEQAEGEGGSGDQPGSLAERQRALRDALRDQQARSIPGDGTEQGEETRRALDEAARAMEEAEERLRQGDAAGALDRQARAIEQLREGLRGMNEALLRRDGEGGDGQAGAETGDRVARVDPLGRATGPGGATGTDQEMLPGEDVHRRAREILDEIRRRSAERDRPQAELDYLGRLLERF